jgi:hypothetical protein
MTTRNLRQQILWLSVAGAFVLLFSLLSVSPATAQPRAQETEKYCLSCHGDKTLSMTLPSGETLSLYVAQDDLS